MNHLLRNLAPIDDAAWTAVDDEARRALEAFLSARRIVELVGPRGWDHAAEPTGRTRPVDIADGVTAAARTTVPLVELRVPFTLRRAELDAVPRGAKDPDLAPVVDAARRLARAEDRLVYYGSDEIGVAGLVTGSPHDPVELSEDYGAYPRYVAQAVARLREAGVGGPYAIALGAQCHTGIIGETEMGGYPILEHLRLILGGPVVYAPAVDGAVVVSMRGGDFELVSGQDISVGYLDHDADTVTCYLEESLTFRNLGPEAAVPLLYP